MADTVVHAQGHDPWCISCAHECPKERPAEGAQQCLLGSGQRGPGDFSHGSHEFSIGTPITVSVPDGFAWPHHVAEALKLHAVLVRHAYQPGRQQLIVKRFGAAWQQCVGIAYGDTVLFAHYKKS